MFASLHRLRRTLSVLVLVALGVSAWAIVGPGPAHSAPSHPVRVAAHRRQTATRRAATRRAATRRRAVLRMRSTAAAPPPGGHWLATWGAAPQGPTPGNLSVRGFGDQTLREIVLTSAGGSMARVRLTNVFGSRPLTIDRATVAQQRAGATLVPGTIHTLTFAGQQSVIIPPGAEVLSDPVAMSVASLTHLAISLYVPLVTGPATEHFQARQLNYVASGDHTLSSDGTGFNAQSQSWYFLDGVEVLAPARDLGTVVAIGDSITDGVGSPLNGDARWPNDLSRRLNALPGDSLSVVDEGIGGNRVLNDSVCCGIDAVARFERDVLGQPGVRDVILLEGINDIGYDQSTNPLNLPHTDVSALQIVDGYEQMIALAHAAGLKIFGATLTPFEGARYWTPANEAKRDAVNRWIRASGQFNGVIDFAAAVADPADPERLAPQYDSGDHLHPDAAGYRAMANAIDLSPLLAG
ncbi:MAG TPA: SGNH/GDSL hydrolase family protein [Solirubrobacteraceae bacterium]|nr:SGNH/GDSL hydrolase family protein [Solirubrobacteraceae bacterium]